MTDLRIPFVFEQVCWLLVCWFGGWSSALPFFATVLLVYAGMVCALSVFFQRQGGRKAGAPAHPTSSSHSSPAPAAPATAADVATAPSPAPAPAATESADHAKQA